MEDNSHITAFAERERARFKGKVIAFTPVDCESVAQPWQVGIAVLGESGYAFPTYAAVHSTYEAAHAFCDVLNGRLGYERETAIVIVAETMNRSSRKREEADPLLRFKVTVSVDPAELSDDQKEAIADALQESIEASSDVWMPDHDITHIEVVPA